MKLDGPEYSTTAASYPYEGPASREHYYPLVTDTDDDDESVRLIPFEADGRRQASVCPIARPIGIVQPYRCAIVPG